MITSPKVREAFDLSKEPAAAARAATARAGKYPHQTVKNILYDWDAEAVRAGPPAGRGRGAGGDAAGRRSGTTTAAPTQRHLRLARHCLLPLLDRSIYALVDDLEDRGLADDVLVVVLGEFGRTPKITHPGPGREHWADAGVRAAVRRRAEDGAGDRRDRLAGRAGEERAASPSRT